MNLALYAHLLACSADGSKSPGEAVSDGDVETDTDVDVDTDTDTDTPTEVTPPCADGTWGLISSTEAVHVRADGDDGADGSASAPVATLARALALVREDGAPRRIAVGPGTYAVALELEGETADHAADDGLALEACGAGEVVFEAADPDASVVTVSRATDVVLAGFTISGGTRALKVWNGASVVATALDVTGAAGAGIVFDGDDCLVDLSEVTVRDTLATEIDGVEVGYGISVNLATVTMSGGGVWGTTAAGILGEGATIELVDVTVADTAATADGYYGRGVQVQEQGTLAASGVTLTGNADAGLFALRAFSTSLDGLTVDATSASAVPDLSGITTGDGVVVTQGDAAYDPATFLTALTGSDVADSARAGVLFDGVTADVSGNSVAGSGYDVGGVSILCQGGTKMTGTDAWVVLEDAGESPLDLNTTPLSVVTATP
ncbi:MAG: hypothetical protein ACOZNI_14935 [Myxococcota bacterium]